MLQDSAFTISTLAMLALTLGGSSKGGWMPGISVFQHRGDRIVRVSDTKFDAGDDFCVVWHMFDLLPGGAGDWSPRKQYT